MDQLIWARKLLEESGYTVTISNSLLLFEDETLYGFVCFTQAVTEILANWESTQDAFLNKYALSIRRGALKSWNAYSIFLSPEKPTESARAELTEIEEDFRATRKIVKTEVVTQKDVKRALFPLLPIQHPVQLSAEDMKERILERVSLSTNQKSCLFSATKPDEFLALILEED